MTKSVKRSLWTICMTGVALVGCAELPGEDAISEQSSELLLQAQPINGGGLNIAPPLPVVQQGDRAMFRYAGGETAAPFESIRTSSMGLRFRPNALSGFRLPAGGPAVYSAVYVRDLNIIDARVDRNQTLATFQDRLATLSAQGWRAVDVDGDFDGTKTVYHSAFVKETSRPLWGHYRGTSIAVQNQITTARAQGYRPIRLHCYRVVVNNVHSTECSVTFVKDSVGTDVRTYTALTSEQYSSTWSDAKADGYVATDLDVYSNPQSQLRWAAIFTKDSTVKGFVTYRDLSRADFLGQHQELVLAGYKLVDVEAHGVNASAAEARISGIWHRPENDTLRSNLSFADQNLNFAQWSALDRLEGLIETYQDTGHEMGFVVQDHTNGNKLTLNPDRPFYMASISKVIIAAYVMTRIDAGVLAANTQVPVTSADLLDAGDLPDVTGNFSVDQLLRWMLNSSSTDATDLLVKLVGQGALNSWIATTLGVENINEVTSICEVDMRIAETDSDCIRQLTCAEFMPRFRDGVAAPANCQTAPTSGGASDTAYRAYYATLANTSTPRAYAEMWKKVLDPQVMSAAQSQYLLSILDAMDALEDDAFCTSPGVSGTCDAAMADTYNDVGMKDGGKRWIRSWVAVPFVQAGTAPNITWTAQYTVSFFTNQEPMGDTNVTVSRNAIRDISAAALAFLQAAR